METKYLIILIILAIAFFSIFFYQYSNDVETFIIFNETEVDENGTFSGSLMDAYARGVPNKTITYHQAGDNRTTFVSVTTNDMGVFQIKNVKNLPESGENNYYGDISFKGDGQFRPCTYEYNLTVRG